MGLLVLIFAVSDIVALLYISHIFDSVFPDPLVENSKLEIANQYIGLEDLYKSGTANASKLNPILIEPRTIAQVFRDKPNQLAPLGEHEHMTELGTIAPREQHLYIDANTHTIAQFRAVDFGMEDCSLVVILPADGEPDEGDIPLKMTTASTLVVHALDTGVPLDIRKLSWRTKPARVKEVASFVPRAGEETFATRFPCEWASLHTFEVSCETECLLDVWSSHNGTWGIYIYQHQTI
ncbi:hypothetical protein OBBRIDRAFT_738779 [Obba rivulosa]|uniref:Ubiquitin 3 binding protein But2 C-terminal domain-containing protein n=1 Tax=Obba rivulosa TaxID=1052685 RepID=A0A8E2APK9_9APHY|nr:hypothetical protein OBBRIDRAFT_738779 [Obba rivulosa]